jgi:serine/threonine-protein kinase HipA
VNELAVLLDGADVGRVHRDGDRLRFQYQDEWRTLREAYPLSLSMPLVTEWHGHDAIAAYMWGLLPDDELVLAQWGRRFGVSSRNPFALLSEVGEDCAGAVQIVRPERIDAMRNPGDGAIAWIDESEVGDRLAAVIADASAGRRVGDHGQFSLAGAQPKTALLNIDGRWGVPSGRVPTTHILKPPSRNFDGLVENEHFCLTLARALGLRSAASQVLRFGDQTAFVATRYDRLRLDGLPDAMAIIRVHQEDMCQALGVYPWQKYQADGGPTAAQIYQLIRESTIGRLRAGAAELTGAADEPRLFLDALIFNWLIGGTDAHAKNYGFIMGRGPVVRFAPLYDLVSAYGFPRIAPQKMKLAMKIGSKYRVEEIVLRHWREWAKEAKVDPDAVVARIASMVARFPDALDRTRMKMCDQGLTHPIIDRLYARLLRRAGHVAVME